MTVWAAALTATVIGAVASPAAGSMTVWAAALTVAAMVAVLSPVADPATLWAVPIEASSSSDPTLFAATPACRRRAGALPEAAPPKCSPVSVNAATCSAGTDPEGPAS